MGKIIFNARYNSISKIVDSFIQNDQYLELITDSNSIISGPRGCGKTTLLNNILQNLTNKKVAIIENEFGEGMF